MEPKIWTVKYSLHAKPKGIMIWLAMIKNIYVWYIHKIKS